MLRCHARKPAIVTQNNAGATGPLASVARPRTASAAVAARQEPVAGDDLLDDARLARLVVPDDVRVAEAVERGGEEAGGEEQRQPVSGRQTGPARRAAPSSGPRRP